MLLVHSLKNVQDALLDSCKFFYRVLPSCKEIYLKPGESNNLLIPEYDESIAQLHQKKVLHYRENRASALLNAAADVTEENNGTVMACMLSHAMVQTCLVYIEMSIGYQPNQLSLKHLFAICRMIDPVIDEIFPTSREDDKKLFDLLLDADKNLRYRISVTIGPTDQGMLLRRCDDWIEKVKEKFGTQAVLA